MNTVNLRKLALVSNDGVLRGPALGAADEIDRIRAENERLTKERDEARAEHRFTLGLLDRAMTERDEARAQVAAALEAAAAVAWDDRESGLTVNTKIRALAPDDAQAALQSMLADAERDMRQRAADACAGIEVDRWDKWKDGSDMLDQGASDGAGDCVNAILALPLKHADREEGK
ncbi:hypothetical protein E2976_17445 [Paracoccus yeei]|uniref:hypothetical protein n=1 Tax=Paracoccus yeei TaxID=147645 RepID=UPI003BF84898